MEIYYLPWYVFSIRVNYNNKTVLLNLAKIIFLHSAYLYLLYESLILASPTANSTYFLSPMLKQITIHGLISVRDRPV